MTSKILIATDGSEIAEKAVDEGLTLAKKLGANAILLTATERWSAFEIARASHTTNPLAQYEELAAKHATRILEAAGAKAKAAGVIYDTVHKADTAPAEAIVAEAERRNVDMIIMASNNRKGLDKILVGSQTLKVLALTDKPVLVYR
jgi:nucleotide-binding universal stress UspA family protein